MAQDKNPIWYEGAYRSREQARAMVERDALQFLSNQLTWLRDPSCGSPWSALLDDLVLGSSSQTASDCCRFHWRAPGTIEVCPDHHSQHHLPEIVLHLRSLPGIEEVTVVDDATFPRHRLAVVRIGYLASSVSDRIRRAIDAEAAEQRARIPRTVQAIVNVLAPESITTLAIPLERTLEAVSKHEEDHHEQLRAFPPSRSDSVDSHRSS